MMSFCKETQANKKKTLDNSLFFGYVAAQTGNEKADITLRPAVGAAASPSGPSLIQISYIAAVFGLSLGTNVFIWYRVSGGMFNPSVSTCLWLLLLQRERNLD